MQPDKYETIGECEKSKVKPAFQWYLSGNELRLQIIETGSNGSISSPVMKIQLSDKQVDMIQWSYDGFLKLKEELQAYYQDTDALKTFLEMYRKSKKDKK